MKIDFLVRFASQFQTDFLVRDFLSVIKFARQVALKENYGFLDIGLTEGAGARPKITEERQGVHLQTGATQ